MLVHSAPVLSTSRPDVGSEGLVRCSAQASVCRCRDVRRRVSTIVRASRREAEREQYREEKAWRSELEPKQPLARPPEGLNVVSVLSSVDVDLESSLIAGTQRRDWGVLSPITDRWDVLPARWKVVAATSLAFVICNMVSFPPC